MNNSKTRWNPCSRSVENKVMN